MNKFLSATAVRSLRHLHDARDILFPPYCTLCANWPDADGVWFCRHCAGSLERERDTPACPTCAASVAPCEVHKGRCRRCRGRRFRVKATVRIGPYTAAPSGLQGTGSVATCLARVLRAYKYRQRWELEAILSEWLADAILKAPWFPRIEAIVSVPTHWRRRLRRPWHVADRLGRAVAERAELPWLSILKRIKAGPHQIELNYRERIRNVRGAFALRRSVRLDNARLLLIDDVKTTGATLNECARVLRHNGTAEVYGAVALTAGWDGTSIFIPSSI